MYSVDTLDTAMVRDQGRTEVASARFHPVAQNNVQFKSLELFWNFSINVFRLWLTVGH